MKIQCPSCDQRLEIPEELAGQTIECPACNESLDVPAMAVKPPAPIQQSEPQVAASEKPKSSVLKWAAPVAIIMVVAVGMFVFYSNTAVKTDGESKMSAPAPETIPDTKSAKPEPPTVKAPDMPIQIAAQSGHIEIVEQHITAGADINAKSKSGGTALISATLNGHKEIIELLIANKADLNIGLNNGKWTALHFASTPMSTKGFSDLGILEVLCKSGADVNATDEEGQTPLDVAISSVGGQFLGDNNTHTPVTKLLRKYGAKTSKELKAERK